VPNAERQTGDPVVRGIWRKLIGIAHQSDRKAGLCGRTPSDHPEFSAFLVEAGIDSISLNPDSVVHVIHEVSKAEKGVRNTQ